MPRSSVQSYTKNLIIILTLNFKKMFKILRLSTKFLTQKQSWLFAGNSGQMQRKISMMKRTRTAPKTQIVSLTSDEMNQLSTILHYETSINYLEKNDFDKSLKYAQFALNEAKSKFPESVSLHMCLMNRLSILQRLLGRKQEMMTSFEEIFLFCLSLKGEKSLETTKHLTNYLIALITEDLQRTSNVVEFLEESKFKSLLKNTSHLIGVIKSLKGNTDEGIKLLRQSINNSLGSKYMNYNNIGWSQLVTSSKGVLEPIVIQDQGAIQEIISSLLRSLIQSQKTAVKMEDQQKQIQSNLILIAEVNKYLSGKDKVTKLKQINPQTRLYGADSHIIAMNISYAFFMSAQFDSSIVFLKMAIQGAIQACEIQRLGLGLVLMSKINYMGKATWQNIIQDILEDQRMYSRGVIRECLLMYSKMLRMQKRFYESEDIFFQTMQIGSGIQTEGLILPDFDFSF